MEKAYKEKTIEALWDIIKFHRSNGKHKKIIHMAEDLEKSHLLIGFFPSRILFQYPKIVLTI